MNENDELSLEERNRLYGLSTLPFVVILLASSVYFVYLMENSLLKSMWDVIVQIVLPLVLIGLPLASLTFEILHHRKTKQPLKPHLKRFSGRVLLILLFTFSFFAFLATMNIFLTPIIGEEYVFIGGILTWLLGFFIVLTAFREFFAKLDRGEW